MTGPDSIVPPSVPQGRRIGLLGGSFNPAHQGHRYISQQALKRLRLDEVWWLVSPQNPLKPTAGMGSLAAYLMIFVGITPDIQKTVEGAIILSVSLFATWRLRNRLRIVK